ncbi:hypothetical protein SAMN04490202_2551 [Pseudomonas reinekei]|jgi:hypothetical protein|uniref:Uncharacterized protein n=1 Tax=Pseudomonas reinekei TaxID=395598 RepID=A0A1H0P813_PSERE|nr:hypothetical protein [Pseudomonas reinekei]KAB0485795.1 hypothetical protein F7R15_12475 [Pseudomonas reinekei]OLU02648.1 hypothetical protein BVK86_14345 [Pseudomonas reinekei]SDP00848.1 hypothetical protein SAMN04490202_2551 [Pseudomonas reinekei]
MIIKSKDWTAQTDRMPGALSFRTCGTVTVARTGITPKLEMSALQDKSFDLRLELKLETSNEVSLQVETDKFVEYKFPGNSNVTGVSIFYEGKLLHHIDKVLITH